MKKEINKNIKWGQKIAYAVGLITTDGCLSPDRRHFDFTSKDLQLIRTFKKCLKIDNKITMKQSGYVKEKKYFRIQFGNVNLYKWLLDIGLMPNKSKRMGVLKIPNEFFFDFLRGHLDGDGYIRRFQDSIYPNSQRLYICFCSASIIHLKWLQDNVKQLLNIKGRIRKGNRVFYLKYAKKESLILLPKIYSRNNLPCLERKYKIIHDLI